MYQRFLVYSIWTLLFLSAVVLFFLIQTEKRCIEYAAELAAVRDEYVAYRVMQQRLLEERESSHGDDDEKKKLPDVMFVNRDQDYLRTQAIAHAKAHNLEMAVRKLYEDLPEKSRIHTGAKRQNRRVSPRLNAPTNKTFLRMPPRERIFAWPIEQDKFWVSSPYGPRRRRGKNWEFHGGIDMAALRGTPIYAAAPGVVEQAGWRGGYGNMILIRHDKTYKTGYAHLARILVYPGDSVDRTTMIGRVGDTGLVRSRGKDASHLHYEVYVHGKRVNPFHYTA